MFIFSLVASMVVTSKSIISRLSSKVMFSHISKYP